MKIEVVTLFPRMIALALEFGIVGRAIGRGLLSVGTEDPRAHTTDAHRTVDDRPYGGGPGMVMNPKASEEQSEGAGGDIRRRWRPSRNSPGKASPRSPVPRVAEGRGVSKRRVPRPVGFAAMP